MRGKHDAQAILFTAAVDLEQRIRADHPLRAIKRMADEDLAKMSGRFDAAYASEGRPSVPPERLIKALLLQSIYSIRSEAQLVERIDHDLLFRWFLDLRIDEPVFDATVFCHNRKRLAEHGLIGRFFDGTVRRAMAAGLVSPDHFSVDGSLIEAYASIKSFVPKDSKEDDPGDNNGFKGRNAEVDFHGQKRSNDTHQSTTDPDAKLARKSDGKPALLSHALHAIVENRHGLVLGVEVNSPLDNSEPNTALSLIDRVKKRFGLKPKTVGADKGYDQGPLLRGLERRRIRPHVAVKEGKIGGNTAAYRKKNRANIAARRRMRRRTRSKGYAISQRCRKKIEELFGWAKTIAGLYRTRLIGHWKTGQQAQVAGAAFNLIRMRNLGTA
ncbi:MAG TPA: IS5 family transposase [Tepidisphaeraceae bacterium]|nr:IS5 family transposase [Tepidisphaeraceae bacterium]